jgi:integrase
MARANGKDRGLYQFPRGTWCVEIYHEGKRFRKKIGRKTDARKFLQNRQAELNKEEFFPELWNNKKKKVLLKEEIKNYMSLYQGLDSRNQKRYGDFWTEQLGYQQLDKVTVSDLKKIRITLKNGENGQKEKADGTVNRFFSFIRRIYSIAVEEGRASKNPVKVKKDDSLFYAESGGRDRYLSEDEEVTLKNNMTPEDFKLVSFAINTGLRQSEQFNLKWSNIDRENRVLTIPRTKSGKTRHVQLNDTVMEILESLDSWMISQYVFPSSKPSSPLDGQNFYHRVFIPSLKRAKIQGIVWHSLRHTFASRLVAKGVNLRTVQELMGHQSIEMTERYTHILDEQKNNAVQTLVKKPSIQTVENPEIPVPTAT